MATVLLSKQDSVALITINRPEVLNALNTEVLKELDAAIEDVKADNEVKVVIITGGGNKAFVAGADIAQMKTMTINEAYEFAKLGQNIFAKIETLSKIVIAAVNGFALGGGCELAMACDIRIAAENAKFGQPEVNLGITPGFGGTQRLPRLVGKGKAIELITTADTISANDALQLGLINKVVNGDVMAAAKEMARKILSKGNYAVRYAKLAVHNGLQTDIQTALAYEASMFSLCFGNEEQKEGMTAFLEKRKPKF
ncbi:MAG: 3-hydroxybutyryl-CoA dehydratase [Peptococcaceae bacterium]|jgi:enoyl-CoA hydratase|nr:3-hydroxybutyryl-CoA dehydratase [Peptococcaceae bacterium]